MRKAILLSVVILVGCSSAKKATAVSSTGAPGQPKIVVPTAQPLEIAKASKDQPALNARAVTSLGDNRAPRFSPDGAKLLFLSSARPSHRHTQVYELDLLRMTERRVTFHDGDDEGANWDTNTRIVYSSVTDEMKEDVSLARIKAVYESSKSAAANPNGMRAASKIINGGEIYLQRLDGRAIERITDESGPDISPTADSSTKSTRLVFVSWRLGDPRLFLYNGSTTRAISHGPDAAPAFSFDGKALAWERTLPQADAAKSDSSKTLQSQIFMTENFRDTLPLTSPGFRDQQPAWNAKADAVIFSSNRGGKTFDLYSIDRKASCLKRLTEVQADLFSPTMSPDGSKIAFSMKVNGQNQIYLMDDRSASLPCVTVPTAKP